MLLAIFSTTLSIIFLNAVKSFAPSHIHINEEEFTRTCLDWQITKHKVLLIRHDEAQMFGKGQAQLAVSDLILHETRVDRMCEDL
jgi:hypothetical protein